jgi:serine/threonine protein kinase/DNA-binding SARP family transcriptional activator
MSEEDIFHEALARTTHEGRAAYLDQACAGNAELRASVAALLEANDGAGSFLAKAPVALGLPGTEGRGEVTEVRPVSESPGAVIGPYKLLEQIGEGGFGIVFMAEQQQPIRRKVALKVLKPGMDSKQVIARFQAERQALALMDHTNIAKVLDAGQTSSGRPYFVMDLVKGLPITDYCDQNRLTPRERLQLFVHVCQAVQHAHQKGIIHRDLKPSNVLVTLQDGAAMVKVIDFGIAKALGQQLTDKTMFTGFAQMIGTPLYMSPEQAGLSNVDIDTRSDIYALGVLLYELLTGTTPFEKQRLQQVGYDEMRRIIREEEPPKPSTRISTLGQTAATVSTQRKSDPKRLSQLCRGELDWIVMKCLEKDRTRRYETANGLARDIERHLADEPVEACPPSRGYRLRKFVRRHQGRVLAAGLLLLALVAGMVGTTLGLIEARRQRDEAEQAWLKEAEQRAQAEAARAAEAQQRQLAQGNEKKANLARDQAEQEKKIAEAVKWFLQHDLLRQADATAQADSLRLAGAGAGAGAEAVDNPTIRELLDRAAQHLAVDKIEAKFPGQPLVQAEILQTVGDSYRSVGEYAKAIAHLERAAALRRTHLGPDDPHTLATLNNLAGAYEDAGKTAAAIALFEQVKGAQIAKLGPDHVDTLTTLHNLAGAYRSAGKTAAAIALFEQVRDAWLAKVGPDDPHTLTTLNNLAVAYKDAGKTAAAIALFEKVRDARLAKLGPEHPHTLTILNNLAGAYLDAGKTAAAIALFEQVRDARSATLGADHPNTLHTLHNLADTYRVAGKTAAAIALLEKVRDAQIAKLGPEHPDTLSTLHKLAEAYRAAGRTAAAIALLETVRDAHLATLGPDHPDTLSTLHNLAVAYRAAGKTAAAIALLGKVRDARIAKFGPEHPDTLSTLHNLAGAYLDAGKTGAAIALLETVRDAHLATLGPDHPHTLMALHNLAGAYWSAGELKKSVPLFEEILPKFIKLLGVDHPHTLVCAVNLAVNYRDAKRLSEAAKVIDEWLPRTQAKLGPEHPHTQFATATAASIHEAGGEFARAAEVRAELVSVLRQQLPADNPRLATALSQLGLTLLQAGRAADAEPVLRECLAIRQKKQPEAWTTFNTQSMLGDSLLGQKKYAAAEPLLLAGYEGMHERQAKLPPQGRVHVIEALERLVQLYDAWGKQDKADEWRKKWEEAKTREK